MKVRIAAAPEMHEALSRIVRAIEDEAIAGAPSSLLLLAQSALAKASEVRDPYEDELRDPVTLEDEPTP